MEKTKNQEIAETILDQLGGNKFRAMTGCKNFLAVDNGVRFALPKNKTRANYMYITLAGDDTYTIEIVHHTAPTGTAIYKAVLAGKELPTPKTTTIKAADGIYCDMLQDVFTDWTGLYTRLFQ